VKPIAVLKRGAVLAVPGVVVVVIAAVGYHHDFVHAATVAVLISALVFGLLGALSGMQGDEELTASRGSYTWGRFWTTPVAGMKDVPDVSPTAVLLTACVLLDGLAALLFEL
jgi:hypothetical protein